MMENESNNSERDLYIPLEFCLAVKGQTTAHSWFISTKGEEAKTRPRHETLTNADFRVLYKGNVFVFDNISVLSKLK